MKKQHKNSLIMGGLTSSAGIFVTKALGILYVSPFAALAGGDANMDYYARAYNIYDIVLSISIAGLPFALATMIAKYHLKQEYKNILLIRSLSRSVLALFGFVSMALLMLFAGPIAQISVSAPPGSQEVILTRNVMMIIALAVFTVPLLSSYRGFYQGLKELKTYAFSQVFEQIARIAFLLGVGFILVYIMKFDRIWAVYAAVLSTSVSAVASIIYFMIKDRQVLREIKELAKEDTNPVKDRNEVLKELFYFSVPFLLNVLLNNSNNFINLFFFNSSMLKHGVSLDEAKVYYSMVMFSTNKLTSIPQVVAPGFTTAIIPYITTSFEDKNYRQMRQYILECVEIVFYITIPLSYFLFGISKEIYYVMFGSASNYVLGGEVLRINSITGLLFNLAAVSNALMMALRLRKQNLMVSFGGVVLKFITFVPLIVWFGYQGSIYSNALNQFVLFAINMFLIKRSYKVKYGHSVRRILFMFMSCFGMQLVFDGLRWLGLGVVDQSRVIALFELAAFGILGLLIYVGLTALVGIPQRMFKINRRSRNAA